MQPLNTLTFPLSGASLIEASAGTGKTYTIVNLYLRLLIGHGCQPLSVEQILVVTFTNAATAELKERIRQRLRQAYLDFFAGSSDDAFIQSLIESTELLDKACQRLALASKQMDEAAVFTIHGFCQKALTEHAFESGAMYEQSFVLDESEWLKMATEDYWRKYMVTQSHGFLTLCLKLWPTPDTLLKQIRPLLSRHVSAYQTQSLENTQKHIQQYVEKVRAVKGWWLDNQVVEQLLKAKLKANVKLAKPAFLDMMQQFCQGDALQIDFDKLSWMAFSPEQLTKAAKKGSEDLSHLDFSQFEALQTLLLRCQQDLKLFVGHDASQKVADNLKYHKARLQLLSPDDLLSGLQHALLQQGEDSALASTLKQSYPAALIDEFQDTDPVQFDVFQHVYGQNQAEESSCWIMIGDPKQAIYAFRGADIFTYIKAKHWVDKERHFTLGTNWRSSPRLIDAINQMFVKSSQGFLFEDSIPFYPVNAGREMGGFCVKGQTLKSLDFQHLRSTQNTPISNTDAYPQLAINTANQIADWLSLARKNQASINEQPLSAGDCCVLVRNRNEAQWIKQALSWVNVDSVFLARKSVFATQVAIDLYRLLKAISQPSDERLFKTALIGELFCLNAQQLDNLFNDESKWQATLEQLFHWHHVWQKQGVMRALNRALAHFEVEQGMVKHHTDGMRRLTDLLHLIELLQQQSLQLVGESQLIHWFESCLLEPDHNHEGQQMRLENDANLVQIITLHASKGLEFPLVFIPFASSYKSAKEAVYHNAQSQTLEVDYLNQDSNLVKAEYERLAEDIRLFYVGVTRAIYYCSIGLWNNTLGKNKKQSGFTQSALGSVLMANHDLSGSAAMANHVSDEHIARSIHLLANESDVAYTAFDQAEVIEVEAEALTDQSLPSLQTQTLNKAIDRQWRLTSYSAISSQQAHLEMPTPGLDEGKDLTLDADETIIPQPLVENEKTLNAFSFERGANAGSFLHGVLENIDFQQPAQLPSVIKQQGTWFGIDEIWYEPLNLWLQDVLLSPLSKMSAGLSLAALAPNQVKVEMEFYMPLHQVRVKDFNQIINRFFKQHARDYQFEQLNGMIKGFIDLMFEYDGKFYVADYKSNHLGDELAAYHQGAMEHAMSDHDYHLQAILYTLALHRWLKHKLPNYQYQTHVGGAYYLFIRGMSQKSPSNGVYYFLPERAMIEQLDALFSGGSISQPAQREETDASATSAAGQQQGQLDLW